MAKVEKSVLRGTFFVFLLYICKKSSNFAANLGECANEFYLYCITDIDIADVRLGFNPQAEGF